MVKTKAIVENVFNSEQLTKEESIKIVEKTQDKLKLNENLLKKFPGKDT